ncbi:magnesium and cobalt transport protein CorA [Polymorphobacter megasporae]|uniref:magnesium and cobalt transport protein CorA n=1 Tax=Glacieibacterium megasporae TaxID=2835787 RepID=UPI001C1E63BA|nr:magnesium and cobalt transport protein CorA [Polymorphobacter megasporae]UAJ11011.1 magnesium and cobalt transport protein CorA [Polymorphobacter megasporae]
MAIVSAGLYQGGARGRSVMLDETIDYPDDRSSFVWIDVADPSPHEMQTLAARYGLHPLSVADALKAHQSPKLNVYGDQLFVIACAAGLNDRRVYYSETAVFVGHSHVITVRLGALTEDQVGVRDHLEAAPSLLVHGVHYVVHAILDSIVDDYLPLVEMLEEEVIAMERRTLDSFLERRDVLRIFDMRHDLTRLSRVLRSMGEIASKLVSLDLPCLDPTVRPYFRDVLDHIGHILATVDGLREVLTSVFEISSLLEQQRTGDITRKLAAWAAILAVPTAVAGIYGMNFVYMPELKTHYGYFVVLAGMAVACGTLYLRFKRATWL